MHRPLVGRSWSILTISSRSSSGCAGRRERDDVAHHLGGIGGVVDERLGPDRDLVAEHGGDLVGVTGAAEVAEQRDPVGRLAHLVVESRRLAHPGREQARAQLRLERLAEGVVLRERQRGDELAEREAAARKIGSSPDVSADTVENNPLTTRVLSLQATDELTRRRTHGECTDTDQGGSHRGPDGPALVRGARQRQRRQDGDRRHQRQGRPAGTPRSSCMLEDGATDDAVAAAGGEKLVEDDQVDVVLGGIYSSTRQAIKGPAVVEGKTLYIYPEQYEGQESDPLIFCTGPVPAQQVDPLIPWLMRRDGGEALLPAVGRLHLAARPERARPRGRHGQRRRASSARSTSRSTTPTTGRPSSGSPRAAPTSSSTRSCRPGSTPFFEELHDSGFTSRGGQLVCTYFDENFLNMVPAAHVEGLYGCLDYYQAVERPVQPEAARAVRRALPRRREVHRRQRVLGPLPRAAALGRRRDRGRLARAGGRDRGARPRRDRRGPRRPGGDGAGPAPRCA